MSKYFTYKEMTRSDTAEQLGIDNWPNPAIMKELQKTMALLDIIRERWGGPIIVTSGYRCPELNNAVGGSKKSQHMRGQAADIKPKRGSVRKLFEMIKSMIDNGEITVGQLIDEYSYSWVHVGTGTKNQILHIGGR